MFSKTIIKLKHSKFEDLYFIDNVSNTYIFTDKIEDSYVFLDYKKAKSFINTSIYKEYIIVVNNDISDKYNITTVNKINKYRFFEIDKLIDINKYKRLKKELSECKNTVDKMIYYIKDNNNDMIYNFLLENSDLYRKNIKNFELYNIYIKDMNKDFKNGDIAYLETVNFDTEYRNKKLLKLNKNNDN